MKANSAGAIALCIAVGGAQAGEPVFLEVSSQKISVAKGVGESKSLPIKVLANPIVSVVSERRDLVSGERTTECKSERISAQHGNKSAPDREVK